MLECPKCGHDNELGRIFCEKCGEKLDITKISAPSGIRRRARKGKRTVPLAKMVGLLFGKLLKIGVLAACTSLITLVFLPPRFEAKPFTFEHLLAYEQKRAKLEHAMGVQEKATMVFEEGDINAALALLLKKAGATDTAKPPAEDPLGGETKPEAAPQKLKADLEEIYIGFRKKDVLVTLQGKWKWFRLSLQFKAAPSNQSGTWKFACSRFWLGRLSLPTQLNKKLHEVFVDQFFSAFATEKKWVEELENIEISPGKITLETRQI